MARIAVQEADFDVAAEIAALSAGRTDIGGIALFVGTVRADKSADGAPVRAMTLEHYPAMTERALGAIVAEAQSRWPLLGCTVIHRVGRLAPGENIVLVATASAHRQAALDAAAFLIDWLKTGAPFWKHEETEAGGHWVEARESDDAAALRWARAGAAAPVNTPDAVPAGAPPRPIGVAAADAARAGAALSEAEQKGPRFVILFLRGGGLWLERRADNDWHALQQSWPGYRTSLGPWLAEDVIAWLDEEYGPSAQRAARIRAFAADPAAPARLEIAPS